MMRIPKKNDFPTAQIRRFLEPGPIVLISSAHRGERNIMTLGWHMMLDFEPALVGCYIWDANHSFDLIRASRECAINLPTADRRPPTADRRPPTSDLRPPTADMVDPVIGIGNTPGDDAVTQRHLRLCFAQRYS